MCSTVTWNVHVLDANFTDKRLVLKLFMCIVMEVSNLWCTCRIHEIAHSCPLTWSSCLDMSYSGGGCTCTEWFICDYRAVGEDCVCVLGWVWMWMSVEGVCTRACVISKWCMQLSRLVHMLVMHKTTSTLHGTYTLIYNYVCIVCVCACEDTYTCVRLYLWM